MNAITNPASSVEQLAFLDWFDQHMAQDRISITKVRQAMGSLGMDFVDSQDRSPMGVLCQRPSKLFCDKEADILTLLMERGANPLGPGHLLSNPLGHASRSLLFASRMITFEASNPGRLRGDDGGNIIHSIALRRPRDLGRLFEHQDQGRRAFIVSMAQEARYTDGSTAAHMIWRGIAFDGPGLDRNKKTPDPYDNPVIAALVGTHALMEAGVDLTLADRTGQSAIGLAIECFDTRLAKVPQGWRKTVNELRKLARTTPLMVETIDRPGTKRRHRL